MNYKFLSVTLLVLLLAVLGFVFYGRSKSEDVTVTDSNLPVTQELIQDETEMLKDPQQVVRIFLTSFFQSAPPNTNDEALTKALSLISDNARNQLQDQPTSGDLATFVGIQDIPDESFEIGDVSYAENMELQDSGPAEVEVTLGYSGGDVIKVFQLSKSNDTWKIDSVN